jgi:hypothetical protein
VYSRINKLIKKKNKELKGNEGRIKQKDVKMILDAINETFK